MTCFALEDAREARVKSGTMPDFKDPPPVVVWRMRTFRLIRDSFSDAHPGAAWVAHIPTPEEARAEEKLGGDPPRRLLYRETRAWWAPG